jgi:translation initiation factor 4E
MWMLTVWYMQTSNLCCSEPYNFFRIFLVSIRPTGSMIGLSFNRKLVPSAELDRAIPETFTEGVDVSKPIPLKHTWALWEQLQQGVTPATAGEPTVPVPTTNNAAVTYGDLTTQVAKISDVQTFWHYFTHLPQPSQILGESKKIVRQDSNDGPIHTLAALMFFKDDIRPEWEDEANKKGGHFQFTLQLERTRNGKEGGSPASNWLVQTDEYWNNIVMGLVGATMDLDDFVTGVRLVDKVKPPPRQGGRPVGHIRIEIWFRDANDNEKINALRESLETHMRCRIDGTMAPELFPGYRLDTRSHAESTSGGHDGDKKPMGRKPMLGGHKKFPSRKGSTDEKAAPTVTAE